MAASTVHCPVCDGSRHSPLYPIANGKLVRCHQCHLIFFLPRPTPQELDQFYNSNDYREYYNSSPMANQAFARDRYAQLAQALSLHAPNLISKLNKKLLDVGCGTGDLLVAAAESGWQVTGTELSQAAVKQASEGLGDRVLLGDIHTLDLPLNSYDLVTSYHVIEHLLDPVSTLARLHQLARPGGVVFVETPNIASLGARIRGAKWSHIKPPEHITYFNPDALQYALKQAGYKRYAIFTSAPQVIKSIEKWPSPLQAIATEIYALAPRLDMGAALQAIAYKD
jgi:2-polyprenyl-3-methyl-5-hydroxy-6-metoxy-1,4-benzoquinol methylase